MLIVVYLIGVAKMNQVPMSIMVFSINLGEILIDFYRYLFALSIQYKQLMANNNTLTL